MATTSRAYFDWSVANYADPSSATAPNKWFIRGTPSSTTISFTLDLVVPNGPIRVDFIGEFSADAQRGLTTAADLVAKDPIISAAKVYFGEFLVQDDVLSPAIRMSQTAFVGTSASHTAQYAGDDVFSGSTFTPQTSGDVMMGYAGNDTFYPNANAADITDIVNGGSGMDTVVYRGSRSDYTVTTATGLYDPLTATSTLTGFRVTDRVADRDGSDQLVGVERLRFSDGNIALDTTSVAGKAYRIYKAAFDRAPDAGGLGYWISQMDKGMDMVEVAARFIDSAEFRTLYGTNVSNADFLTKVYNNVLDRNPDAAGLAWWVNEMQTNASKTRQKVLADFSESQENQANVATLIANGIPYEPFV